MVQAGVTMPKTNQTPGTVLNALIEKHGLNYSSLAKLIGISSAMVRLIARDENPISAAAASRLAKFFKQKPEYWLKLRTDYELASIADDKKLEKEIKDIPTVDKVVADRKQNAPKAAKGKAAAGKKPAGKGGPRGPKAGAKQAKPAKNGKAKKPTTGKPGRPPMANKAKADAKAPKKGPSGRGRPAKKEKSLPTAQQEQSNSQIFDSSIDEPQI